MLIEERYKDEDTGSDGINSLLRLGCTRSKCDECIGKRFTTGFHRVKMMKNKTQRDSVKPCGKSFSFCLHQFSGFEVNIIKHSPSYLHTPDFLVWKFG